MIKFIAEMSANHLGEKQRALDIVKAAADAGADAVKIQTWTPGTMCKPDYVIESGPWAGRNLAELYEEAWTPWSWHKDIFDACRDHGIVGFTTVFDIPALRWLEQDHNCPIYKISSFELTHDPLIAAVAKTGKPMIISTGMGTWAEMWYAKQIAEDNGCIDLTMLKCTSSYPAPVNECNLAMIPEMKRRLGCKIGLSDHTMITDTSQVAALLGAEVIERHITLTQRDGGLDAGFSLTPGELHNQILSIKIALSMLGTTDGGPTPSELTSLKLRRGLDGHRGS